jgi:hypothetical protein
LRDGASLTSVVPFTARVFGRAVVMPNLKPPVRTLADAAAYRARVLAAVPPGVAFEPLMTLYLTGALRVRVCVCETRARVAEADSRARLRGRGFRQHDAGGHRGGGGERLRGGVQVLPRGRHHKQRGRRH